MIIKQNTILNNNIVKWSLVVMKALPGSQNELIKYLMAHPINKNICQLALVIRNILDIKESNIKTLHYQS